MGMDIFPDRARAGFAAAYPDVPAHLTHHLADHPLLTLDAMASLATRMRPETMEHNAALDVPLGTPTTKLPANGLTTLQTIERIETCGSWVLLRDIEQDPAYAALMRDVLGEVAPIIEAATGPMIKLRGFVFISSPGALTQPHFDPEYNILFQARGSKTMTLFPTSDPEIIGQPFFERYFTGGQRYLPWRDRFAVKGRAISILPGDAIYVPVFAPHWVQVHEQVSISLSLTWCSEWSVRHANTHRFNHRLRGLGLRPRAPRPFPAGNLVKSLGQQVIDRLAR